ncbi:MAG: hypothetical protein H6544_08020 [Prevotellaceae bacterium]|nr:hypothetical protein [Prevotellaceae bacterium]
MKVKRVVILLVALCATICAQSTEREIELLYFNHGDSVSLRWAPTSDVLFQRSVKSGYVLQRRVAGDSEWTSLTPILYPESNEKLMVREALNEEFVPLREILYRQGRDAFSQEEAIPSTDDPSPRLESVEGEPSIEDQLLFGMALFSCDFSLEVAKAAALHYVDKAIEKGAKYQYRAVFGEDASSLNPNVAVLDVDTKVLSVLPAPKDFKVDFDEWQVDFEWPMVGHKGYYSGYVIERSVDKVNFKPVRTRPIIPMENESYREDIASFRDSLPNQDDVFYYRLKGYSPFGLYGPFSNVVKGQGKYDFKQIDVRIDTVIFDKKNTAEVRWSVDKKYERKIKGFRVTKSSNMKNSKIVNPTLLSSNKRKLKDEDASRSYYYAVEAYGYKEGEVSSSSLYYGYKPDSIPPAVPVGLKATIDSAGVSHISWNPNKESDLLGYRLYFSNSGREDDFFDVLDTIYKDTLYVDTLSLNTLTNNIYYKVLALDRNYNPSALSKTVKVSKPDTIAPVGVVFAFPVQPKESVLLQWENTPSQDAKYMELYRQIDDTGKVVLLRRFNIGKKTESKFEDFYPFSGEVVQYFMVVYDEVGNTTKSRTSKFQTKGERPGCVSELKLKLINEESKKMIILNWKNNSTAVVNRFVVYRKEDGGRMLPIASVRANNTFYEDKSVAIGSKYVYIVRPVSTERVCPAVYSEEVSFDGFVK